MAVTLSLLILMTATLIPSIKSETVWGCNEGQTCTCSSSPCLFRCDYKDDACKRSSLRCANNGPCELLCNQEQSCDEVDLIHNGATDVTIICGNNGGEECADANFDCGTGVCSLDCSGSCSGVQVDVQPSTQQFQCTSGCPSSVNSVVKTVSPTPGPTRSPTPAPTTNPTPAPTTNPTPTPTTNPTPTPTNVPSETPTVGSTATPTISTNNPTNVPSDKPTRAPTHQPSTSPTQYPSKSPSKYPTYNPTFKPTQTPTSNTASPSIQPTDTPTLRPTNKPTAPTQSPVTPQPTKHNEAQAGHQETTADAIDDNGTGGGDELNTGSLDGIMTQIVYMIIGFLVVCCCIMFVLLIMRRRNKKKQDVVKGFETYNSNKIQTNQIHMDRISSTSAIQIPNNSPLVGTHTGTFTSQAIASVELSNFAGNNMTTKNSNDDMEVFRDNLNVMSTPMGPSDDDIINNISNSIAVPSHPAGNGMILEGSPNYNKNKNPLLNSGDNDDDDEIIHDVNAHVTKGGAMDDLTDTPEEDDDILNDVNTHITKGGAMDDLTETPDEDDEFLIGCDDETNDATDEGTTDDNDILDDINVDPFQTPM